MYHGDVNLLSVPFTLLSLRRDLTFRSRSEILLSSSGAIVKKTHAQCCHIFGHGIS